MFCSCSHCVHFEPLRKSFCSCGCRLPNGDYQLNLFSGWWTQQYFRDTYWCSKDHTWKSWKTHCYAYIFRIRFGGHKLHVVPISYSHIFRVYQFYIWVTAAVIWKPILRRYALLTSNPKHSLKWFSFLILHSSFCLREVVWHITLLSLSTENFYAILYKL